MFPLAEIPVEKLSNMPALKVLNVQSNPLDSKSRSALQSAHHFDTLSSLQSWESHSCALQCMPHAVCVCNHFSAMCLCALNYISTADLFGQNVVNNFLPWPDVNQINFFSSLNFIYEIWVLCKCDLKLPSEKPWISVPLASAFNVIPSREELQTKQTSWTGLS